MKTVAEFYLPSMQHRLLLQGFSWIQRAAYILRYCQNYVFLHYVVMKKNSYGMILIAVLLILLAATILVIGSAESITMETKMSSNYWQITNLLSQAEKRLVNTEASLQTAGSGLPSNVMQVHTDLCGITFYAINTIVRASNKAQICIHSTYSVVAKNNTCAPAVAITGRRSWREGC